MTDDVVSATAAALAREIGPDRDEILREMDRRAEETGFPTVGPEVGGWLATLARLADARRIFEFGSGFGYSAYWFARALPEDGDIVLTEIDADELDAAREYFERGGLASRAHFEHGDAIDIVSEYDGPFDVVLIDNEKDRYREAFEAVRGNLRSGSLVLADNAVAAGHVDGEEVLSLLRGERAADADSGGEGIENPDSGSKGIAEYLDHVRNAEGFETVLLPLGEGVAVTRKR